MSVDTVERAPFGPHLLAINDLGREGVLDILRLSKTFSEVAARAVPKVAPLRGKTVATVFFESSTRTRLSFEMAARRLSADVMSFASASSSVTKGESLRDTAQSIDALGVDAIVLRHSSSGVPKQVSRWVRAKVINAGDGQHEHPTQALLDVYTMRESLFKVGRIGGEDLEGVQVCIIGDIRHSRVARSNVAALALLGARVTLVGPPALLPTSLEGWPIEGATDDIDAALKTSDICYLLRLQHERMAEADLGDLRAYRRDFGLTVERSKLMRPDCFIMHPGPMNRGVEIDSEVADLSCSLMLEQVRNGVPARMAVLFYLLASPSPRTKERQSVLWGELE